MEIIEQSKIPQRTLFDGTKVPVIGMGTFGSDRFTADEIANAVAGAIKCGYRLFDGAAVYGNEEMIGDVYKNAIDSGIVKREELCITTKVWNDQHGKGDVIVSCAKSLRDLKLDYVDIFFMHWPFSNYHAPGCDGDARNPDSTPFSVDEFMSTWREMERLVDMGMVKYLGMSSMTIPKLEAVLPLCRIKPAAIEMEIHPGFQQPELFDYIQKHDILPIAFCPIGSPTRPDRDKTSEDVNAMQIPAVVEVAKAHGVHPAVICVKWGAQRGQTPIPFSIYENEYVSNLKCVCEDPLTEEEMASIAAADANCRLIKGQVFLWEGAKGWEDLWDLDGTITK